jgi:hypothetical protein
VHIPENLLRTSGQLVASFAEQRPSEGIVYWFGLELGARAVVTTLVVPNADTSRGDVRTSAEANAEAMSTIIGTPLVLLGQVHSHPAGHVGHSAVDDTETFARFEGALSLVVPYFARYGVNVDECGLYRHARGAFLRVPHTERARYLVVLPGVADFRRSHSSSTERRSQ